MKRKKFLERKLNRLIGKKKTLAERCDASTDAAEVRALTEQLNDINDEIDEIREEISMLEAEQREQPQPEPEEDPEPQPEPEQRMAPPAGAEFRNGTILGAFSMGNGQTEQRNLCQSETMEYRSAFMAFAQNGTPIPVELRSGDAISTTDTQAAVPVTIVREVINKIRVRYGNLYSKVRKLAVQGGVEFPIGDLEADFHWITEATVSPDKKLDKLGTISFKYHTAEIKIAQTFLSSIVTMTEFEAKVTEVIVTAYLKAMDIGIVRGSGKGQMLGILNDERIINNSGHTISMTAAQFSDWQQWRKRFFAKLPLGYRDGEFIFPLSTVDTYLETMHDANNNPVFKQTTGLEVNDGDAMDPNGRFFGRAISLVEPTVLPDFDSASSGDVVGIFWQPIEYGINENFGFTMRRYYDENTNKWVNKTLVIVDGKVLNPEGFYLITKA